MKNKLSDLNDYLFEQLERLNDDDLEDEELNREIKKSKAVTGIAETIVKNAEVSLNAMRFLYKQGYKDGLKVPKMIASDVIKDD